MIIRRARRFDDDDDDDVDDVDNDDDDDDRDDANEDEEEERTVFLPSNRWYMLLQSSLRILGILAHDDASMPPGERCLFWLTAGVLLTKLPGISPLLPQSAASAMPNI